MIRPGWATAAASSASGRARPASGANGQPVITYGWYRSFIQFLIDSNSAVWFSKVIVAGELLVGLGLLFGGLVGIAAFFGALMNMSFLMAGTVSTNPVLFFGGILLILAWKNAGYFGIDRFLLPALGTPWSQATWSRAPPQSLATPSAAPPGGLSARAAPSRRPPPSWADADSWLARVFTRDGQELDVRTMLKTILLPLDGSSVG